MAHLDHSQFSTSTSSVTKPVRGASREQQIRWEKKFRYSIGAEMNIAMLLPLQVTDYLHLRYMPKWSRCANEDKKLIPNKLPLFDYLDAHYVDLHPPFMTKKGPAPERRIAIILDVDSDVRPSDMVEIGMPLPKTFTGASRDVPQFGPVAEWPPASLDNSIHRPHMIYWLHTPVWMDDYERAREYKLIARRLAKLVGTIAYVEAVNPVTTKNPAKLRHYNYDDLFWDVVEGDDRTWTLEELDEAITAAEKAPLHPAQIAYTPPVKAKPTSFRSADGIRRATHAAHSDNKGSDQSYLERTIGASFDEEYASRGKNCNLFTNVKYLAYAYKQRATCEQHLYRYVLQQCVRYNETNFSHDLLPADEIHDIAKSISSWTWNYYTGSGKNKDRGACHREGLIRDSMELDERQAIGGRYAAKQNADKKRDAVLKAVAEVQAAGEQIVISKLARELGMSRNTFKKYLPDALSETASKAPIEVSIKHVEQPGQTGAIRGNHNIEPENPGTTKPDLYEVGGPNIEGYGILSSIWSDCSESILQRGHQEAYKSGRIDREYPLKATEAGFQAGNLIKFQISESTTLRDYLS